MQLLHPPGGHQDIRITGGTFWELQIRAHSLLRPNLHGEIRQNREYWPDSDGGWFVLPLKVLPIKDLKECCRLGGLMHAIL